MRLTRPVPGPPPRCLWPCSPDGWSSARSSPDSSFAARHAGDQANAQAVKENPVRDGRYGSMSAMPNVARWWRKRSDPQRLHLYTRWSFYGAIGLTPLLAMLGLGSTVAADAPVLLGLVAGGAAAVAVLGVLLVRTGRGADPPGPVLPRRLLALSWG